MDPATVALIIIAGNLLQIAPLFFFFDGKKAS